MSGPIYDGTLKSAKQSAKNWFLEFIRGTDNYYDDKGKNFDRLQDGHEAGDIIFKMNEKASQQNYMKIKLDGEPYFFDDDELRCIFYHAPFHSDVHPSGYTVSSSGATGTITFDRDKTENRYDRDDVDSHGNPIEDDDDEYDFDDDGDGDGFDDLDF